MIIFDASEALAVAADVDAVAGQLVDVTKAAVVEAATEARDAMRVDMQGSRSFGHAAGSITFDLSGTEAEIGPTKPAGSIANIAYFGGRNRGGETVRDPLDAAESTDPVKAFERALDGLL